MWTEEEWVEIKKIEMLLYHIERRLKEAEESKDLLELALWGIFADVDKGRSSDN